MEPGVEKSVIRRRLSRRFEAWKVVEGALVGLTAGVVVTLYRVVLSQAERLLRAVTQLASTSTMGML